MPRRDGPGRRGVGAGQGGRREPAFSNGVCELRIGEKRRATGARWHQLGDDAIPVGYEDRLASGGEPDVLAQFVLERLEPHRAHAALVASGSYLVNQAGLTKGTGLLRGERLRCAPHAPAVAADDAPRRPRRLRPAARRLLRADPAAFRRRAERSTARLGIPGRLLRLSEQG